MIEDLIKLINGELAAAIQYKIAAESLVGSSNFNYIKEHCEEHFEEEMDHYQQLVAALMQRGGSADITVSGAVENALPATEELESAETEYIRDFFVRTEDAAIKAYLEFHETIKDEDPDLDDIIMGIVADEREHKLDFARLTEVRPTLESYRTKQRANRLMKELLNRRK